jgi:hypothetical protein
MCFPRFSWATTVFFGLDRASKIALCLIGFNINVKGKARVLMMTAAFLLGTTGQK